MRLGDFDYALPAEAIAQTPCEPRDHARLLVLERRRRRRHHTHFYDLPRWLRPGDLLVLNDTRVRPARLPAHRPTGGRLDLLVVEAMGPDRWRVLVRARRRPKPGETIRLGRSGAPAVLERDPAGWILRTPGLDLELLLEAEGRAPLPPYIKRAPEADPRDPLDRERYQTIYARRPGAVAAPTAGLHFTARVFAGLRARGVRWTYVTLHVGPGTFLPIRAPRIEEHRMHAEAYEIPAAAAAAVAETRAAGGRIIPVGTTSLRALEAAADAEGRVKAGAGRTDLYIRPGYRFRVTDGLVTNFHLPRSTLLVLVSALAGREEILAAYAEALRLGYRFYSYGDAMLIL